MTSEDDMVNSPPHYNQHGIECIAAIEAATGDNFKYYLQGNILKYMWRFDYKGKAVEDAEKAQWYLCKLIQLLKGKESAGTVAKARRAMSDELDAPNTNNCNSQGSTNEWR